MQTQIETGTSRTISIARSVAATIVVAVALVVCFGSGVARAGSYDAHVCDANPFGAAPPNAITQNSVYIIGANCNAGSLGFLRYGYPGLSVGIPAINWSVVAYGQISLITPTGTVITSGTFEGRLASGNGHGAVIVMYAPNGSQIGFYDNFTPGHAFGQDAPFQGVIAAGSQMKTMTASLSCGGSCPYTGGATEAFMWGFHLTLEDSVAPVVTGLTGDLVAGGVRHGRENLHVNATDTGSGVHFSTVKVNGTEVARPIGACSFPGAGSTAGALRPCGDMSQTIELDTEKAPWADGSNVLEVCAFDVATGGGSANRHCLSRTVEVDNSCQPSAGTPGDSLNASLVDPEGKAGAQTINVLSNQNLGVDGRLTGAGAAVPGGNICVFEKPDTPLEKRELIAVARTKSDGSFGVPLVPGPSRYLDLVYRFNNHTVEKGSLYVSSRVVPQFRALKRKLNNGQLARFRGTLPPPQNSGRTVALQAKVGHIWRTFKKVPTTTGGAFKAIYRFKRTQGRVTYKFRALVGRQASYPYKRGASKRVKVTVTG